MIAEALTRRNIPERIPSFCGLSGYTILTRYRDYLKNGKHDRIFHYFTAGCNRDGLALRVLGRELEDSPCEHELVVLLSDAKPNVIIKIYQGGSYVDYTGSNGIQNTAMECAPCRTGVFPSSVYSPGTTRTFPSHISFAGAILPASGICSNSLTQWEH